MSDAEKGKSPDRQINSDEAAAAKLWAVYISEAEKYDKSLVESWRSDMEGMLIFAGLFSASLTAFLIESYKTLIPDSGDQTVKLLAQISQQLASGSNGTTFPISTPIAFTPSAASLVCNALWFISLGLSLTCALIATLLEQWARDFIHRADMRSAPLIRARIYSYLYYGMKRFNMHVVVDVIPLLLHASLLFFFSGLVAFLIPVNIIITAISATILVLVATAYSALTFLPLRDMDCPYRTPLSGAFWRLLQRLRSSWARATQSTPTPSETMVEVMTRRAGQDSSTRRVRDYRALVWTVKSLADNAELEPFVDALADALWDHTEQHPAYACHIQRLVYHPDLQLRSRIDALYESCHGGLLSFEARNRRQIACYKAFWAISSLSWPSSDPHPPVDFHDSSAYHEWRFADQNGEVNHYAVSAGAMMKWSTFSAVQRRLVEQAHYLAGFRERLGGPNADFLPITSLFHHLALKCSFYINGNPYPIQHSELTESNIPQILQMIHHFQTSAPHTILFEYLRKSAALDSQPYQWEATLTTISIDRSLPFFAFRQPLEWNLATLMQRLRAHWTAQRASEFNWKDTAIAELCSFWRPENPVTIPSCIIHYINHRNSDAALKHFARRSRIMPYLWSCFPKTLSQGASLCFNEDLKQRSSSEDLLTSLWAMAFFDDSLHLKSAPLYEDLIEAISVSEFPHISVSATALIKYRILQALHLKLDDSSLALAMELINSLNLLFPADTAILPLKARPSLSAMQHRIGEAKLHVLAEFLQHCSSNTLPYKAVETVGVIAEGMPMGPVHKTHQIRLATGIEAVFASNSSTDLMNTIISSSLLDIAELQPYWVDPWLDDPLARQKLRLAFEKYEQVLATSNPDACPTRARLRAIVDKLGDDKLEAVGTKADTQSIATEGQDDHV